MDEKWVLYDNPISRNLAHIYLLLGQHEEAIKQLEFCLSEPGDLTLWILKLDPIYDPLREYPGFQKLIE